MKEWLTLSWRREILREGRKLSVEERKERGKRNSLFEVVFLAILIEKAFEICLSDLREKREERERDLSQQVEERLRDRVKEIHWLFRGQVHFFY